MTDKAKPHARQSGKRTWWWPVPEDMRKITVVMPLGEDIREQDWGEESNARRTIQRHCQAQVAER
jgi:hypothetical protein